MSSTSSPSSSDPMMSRKGFTVVKQNKKNDNTNRDRDDRDSDSEESDITMTQALMNNPTPSSSSHSHNSHQYNYHQWLTTRSRPQSSTSSRPTADVKCGRQKQQKQQKPRQKQQQKPKQKKIQQHQQQGHKFQQQNHTDKQGRVSNRQPDSDDDDDDSVTVVPSVKGPPDPRRFYGPNAVHRNSNSNTNTKNTEKEPATDKSSATSHTTTAKSRQKHSKSGNDQRQSTTRSRPQAVMMPPARSGVKNYQDGTDRDEGHDETSGGTMMESPTSKSMAALSQNVSPVHYAPSPQEQHTSSSKKTTKTGGRDDPKRNKSEAKDDDDDDSFSVSASSSSMSHGVKNPSTTHNKNESKNNDRRIQDLASSSSTAKDTATTQQDRQQKKKPPNKSTKKDTSKESQKKPGTSRSNNNDGRTKTQTTTSKRKTTKDEIESRASKSSPSFFENQKSTKQPSSVSKKNDSNNASDSDTDSSSNDEDPDVHPFCKRCVYEANHAKTGRRPAGGVPKIHHSWCPQNLTSERGETRLRIIQMGRKLNCDGCQKEYTTGKVVTAKGHNLVCRQNSKKILFRLRKEIESTDDQNETAVATTKKQTSSSSKGNLAGNATTKRKLDQVEEEEDESSSLGEGDLDSQDEISEYQPAKKTKTIHTIRPTKKTVSKQKKSNTAAKKAATGKQLKAKGTAASRSKNTTGATVQNSARSNRPNNSQEADDESDEEDEAVQLKPKWVPVDDNPWGPEGWSFGDVVLFGPEDSGMWHPEMALPSPRYVVQPFKTGSNYRITHFTPEEGLSVLSLSRDPMRLRPWGFQVTRDEFGSACLVSSVDVASPASAATLLGIPSTWPDDAPSPHGLNRNDMILAINGQQIGGMTVETLAVELQSTGSNLQLVVSRYKHHEEAAERFAKAEREVLDTMDTATRDERLLGWKEIGNGPVERVLNSKDNHMSMNPSRSTISFDRASSKIPHSGPNEKDVADGTEHNKSGIESAGDIPSEINDKMQNHSQEGRVSTEKSSPTSDDSSNSSLDAVTEGCICGEIHEDESKKMFWLQCEGCKTWFDVAEECVGFSEAAAVNINDWQCDACEPPQNSSSTTIAPVAEDQNVMGTQNEIGKVVDDKARQRSDKEEEKSKNESEATARCVTRGDSKDDVTEKQNESKAPHGHPVHSPTRKLNAEGWSRNKAWWISPNGKTKILGTASAIAALDGDQPEDSCDDSVASPTKRLQAEGWTKNHIWWFSPGGKTKKRGLSDAIAYLDRTKINVSALPKKDNHLKTTLEKKEELVENGWNVREMPNSVFVCSSPGGTKCRGINKAHDRLKARENDNGANDAGSRSRTNLRVKDVTKRPLDEPSRLSSRIAKKKKPKTDLASTNDAPAEEDQGQPSNESGFAVGELVHVKHHAWPGRYAYEGAAKIVSVYNNDDGDRLYSVKYIIHKTTIHDIQEQYISREESE